MSSLYYHNLPNVTRPEVVQFDARMNLDDIERYLKNAKERQQKRAPLVRWELCGSYYEIFSEELSQTEITSMLSGGHELRGITESGEEKLPLAFEYPKKRMIVLNHYIDFPRGFRLRSTDDDKDHVVGLKQVALGRIGEDVKLPHYRIEVLPFNEADESNENLEKFFDDYNKHVQDLETTWITDDGIDRRMLKRPYKLWAWDNRIEIQHRDRKNHAIHLKKLPSSDIIALKPNTYETDRQLIAIRKLKSSPLPEHRPLIRLFELEYYAEWPDVRSAEGDY